MANRNLKIEQQDASTLAAGYSRLYRWVEIGFIVTFFSCTTFMAWKISQHTAQSPWLVLTGFIVGFFLADFTSGFVHWMGDTWGSTEMPVLGKALIRPFREHHVDEKAITRHDYIETNGSNCGIAVPWAIGSLFIPLGSAIGLFAATSIISMIFWVMMTNQFHKWAHLNEDQRGPVINFLQKWHLVLPPAHHQIHHTAPFSTYYCITTGWLNWPLHKLRFFRIAERLVTAVTGLVPRKDDIGLDAALATAPAPLEVPKAELQKAEATR